SAGRRWPCCRWPGRSGSPGSPCAGEEDASYTSVRNAFPGIVTAIKLGDVAAQVEIQAGPHRLVSLLTREAVEELGLEVGMEATARVKSTNVHIDRV
ncbi:TOBE domain-containing protein, partial [Streptomyces sp. NPDC003233]